MAKRSAWDWVRGGRDASAHDRESNELTAVPGPARTMAAAHLHKMGDLSTSRPGRQAVQETLVALPLNPIPNGGVVGVFAGHDGTELRFARWGSTRGPRRGTFVIFPGRAEFIEKYLETVADLRRRGFAVAIMDWRGQGGSARLLADPRKGHVEDFTDYDKDLRSFMREVVLPDCPPPYFALAHSLGGHVLLRNAAEDGSWFERSILVSPMVRIHAARLPYAEPVVAAYARVAQRLGLGRDYVLGGGPGADEDMAFDGNPLTGDKERFERNRMLMRASPQLLIGAPTVSWLASAMRSMAVVQRPDFAQHLKVPIMVFVAGADTIVESRSTEDFVARTKLGLQVRFEGARHELLQERDDIRARLFAALDAYLGVET